MKRRIIKLAVIAGTIGPVLFGAVLLVALPAAFMPPLVGLAGLVLLLVVLIGLETRRYAALRAGVRPG